MIVRIILLVCLLLSPAMAQTTQPAATKPAPIKVIAWGPDSGHPSIRSVVRIDHRYPDWRGAGKAKELMAAPEGYRWLYLHALPDVYATLWTDPAGWVLRGGDRDALRQAVLGVLAEVADAGGRPEVVLTNVEFAIDGGEARVMEWLARVQASPSAAARLPAHLRTIDPKASRGRHVVGVAIREYMIAVKVEALRDCVAGPVRQLWGDQVAVINSPDDGRANVAGYASPQLYHFDDLLRWRVYVEHVAIDVAAVGPQRYIPTVDRTGGTLVEDLRALGVTTFLYFNHGEYRADDPARLFDLK